MRLAVTIDLHLHSTSSDGLLSPSRVAHECAAHGVRFAALTDHNTMAGLDAFESACERYGVGFVSGMELSLIHEFKEIHLLCYGFNRTDAGVSRLLAKLKSAQVGTGSPYATRVQVGFLIETIHRAGGAVFLAHPSVTEPDADRLETLVGQLFALGLDGLEAVGGDGMVADSLRRLASRHDGLISSGTDYHGPLEGMAAHPGVGLPMEDWRAFRDRLVERRQAAVRANVPTHGTGSSSRGGRIRILFPMVLPALAVIGLFAVALFGFFLPHFESSLLERKRETIRELTRTIWSMLDEAERRVQAGELSPDEARSQVIERVRGLRYGREGLDYFWLQDLSPRMIMHPYRSDLDGQDLSEFRDPLDSRIFVLFADKVRRDGAGYVDYVWQWKDDPARLEAKESYIKLFEPWGWVIGTGLYINDVKAEIRELEVRVYHVMLAITAALVVLLLLMLRGGVRSERMRLSAERRLHESNARYASLVRATAEGVLFVRNLRCAYANPVFLELVGCDAEELSLLSWQEIFPLVDVDESVSLSAEGAGEVYHPVVLYRRRDGGQLSCRMAIKGMPEGETGSFVVLVRRSEEAERETNPADNGLLKRLLNLPAASAEDIAREIADTETAEDVIDCCRRTPELVRAMLESSGSPTVIARMLASITDAATTKFVQLTQAELGPEPVPFAFLVVGSQGRNEQTLYTDQDNIVIYDNVSSDPGAGRQAADYFDALGKRVCALLAQAGYRECEGQLMASNPKWNHSVASWKNMFTRWISSAAGQEAMDFMTLFDMRCVYGEPNLLHEVRAHIHGEIKKSPWFFTQAARNAIQFKTPLRLFGAIVTTGRASEKSGHIDLKAAMMPIVCYVRLYALKHHLASTSTPERLTLLRDQGCILPSRYHDILTAFDTLMRLRLWHQSEGMRKGTPPDNLVRLAELGHIAEAVLRECFSEIDRIQKGIVTEFLGGEAGNQ